jgi:GR25 family glycosyltransferase involved in LPS biosynthesis
MRSSESFVTPKENNSEKLFTNDTALYIISLNRKREKTFDLLKSLKMPHMVTLVNAVDGEDLSEELATSTKLRRGQIGCFASHMLVLEHIVKHGIQYALILEDDTRISFPNELEKLNDYIEKTPRDWEILTFTDAANKKVEVQVNDKIIVPGKELWNTHVYMVTLEGANKLIDIFKETGYSEPYDNWLYATPLKIYSSVDAPFHREDLGSDTITIL